MCDSVLRACAAFAPAAQFMVDTFSIAVWVCACVYAAGENCLRDLSARTRHRRRRRRLRRRRCRRRSKFDLLIYEY